MAITLSFSEAVAAGQQDSKAEELGGYVVADVGDQQFIHLPTGTPDAALSDIGASNKLGPNAEVTARYWGESNRSGEAVGKGDGVRAGGAGAAELGGCYSAVRRVTVILPRPNRTA